MNDKCLGERVDATSPATVPSVLINANTPSRNVANMRSGSKSLNRAHQLGCIDQTRFKSIFTQFSRNGWRKTEPVQTPRESPLGFKRLLREHVRNGFTTDQLATTLLVSSQRCHELLVDAASPDWQEAAAGTLTWL